MSRLRAKRSSSALNQTIQGHIAGAEVSIVKALEALISSKKGPSASVGSADITKALMGLVAGLRRIKGLSVEDVDLGQTVQGHVAEAEADVVKALEVLESVQIEKGSSASLKAAQIERDLKRGLGIMAGLRRVGGINLDDEDLLGEEERKKARAEQVAAHQEKVKRARRGG